VLGTIRSARLTLSKSEDKVADFVLNEPEDVVQASIQSLAKKCGVSEPTVVRFCRAIGCSGYHDFKLKLARSMASQEKYFVVPWNGIEKSQGWQAQRTRQSNKTEQQDRATRQSNKNPKQTYQQ